MPFKSEKQRKYMWAKKPKVAKKWAEGYQDGGVVKPERSTIFHGSPAIDLVGSFKNLSRIEPEKKSSLKIYRNIFNSKIKLRKGLLK
tara:strand:+ start:11 stop:271 length:261 start_codon:yes stop_codon:yes gene_type:complete